MNEPTKCPNCGSTFDSAHREARYQRAISDTLDALYAIIRILKETERGDLQ